MKVGVVADVVFFKRGNDIAATAPFEYSGLFTDQLERRANAAVREHFGQTLRRVVVGRQEIILRVEPKNDVDVGYFGGGD